MVAADVHALIKVLRDEHGFGRGHAVFVGGVLLERRGRERRGRVLFGYSALYFGYGKTRRLNFGLCLIGLLLMDTLAALFQLTHRLEGGIFFLLVLKHSHEVPVLLGHEGLDLALPVYDEAQCYRLHPARRQPVLYAVIEKWRELVAHEPVQHPSRLLGIDKVIIYFSGVLERVLHGLGRNFVELYPVFAVRVEAQHSLKVPAYGFALAVGVGRKIDFSRFLSLACKTGNYLLLAGRFFVPRLEVARYFHAQSALGQIADMSSRGVHLILAL